MKWSTLICLAHLLVFTGCTSSLKESAVIASSHAAILEQYPLTVGVTRVYSVTVDYDVIHEGSSFKFVSVSGLVTETVTEWNQVRDTLLITSTFQAFPRRLISEDKQQYNITGNKVFVDGRETLQWPLEVGREGDPFNGAITDAAPGWYVWRVSRREDVTTPAGVFADCFRLELWTQPDHTIAWFYPGVGIVRTEYHHHGSVDNRYWELQGITKP